MEPVLILVANRRSAIACARSLSRDGIDFYLAFEVERKDRGIAFRKYEKNVTFQYSVQNAKAFLNSLLAISERLGNYRLILCSNATAKFASKFQETLKQNGITVDVGKHDAYRLLSNKYEFLDYSEKFGLPIPKRLDYNDVIKDSFLFKFVVKPKEDGLSPMEGLQTPFLVETDRAFEKLKSLNLNPIYHFVEKYISGPSYYYCAYYCSGLRKACFTQKTLAQRPGGGSVVKAIPYDLPQELTARIDKLMHSINWQGAMMVEFKESRGNYFVIECNPRYWGPLQLAIDNGVNFPLISCGVEATCQIENGRNFGYLWIGGYVLGFIAKLKNRGSFQIHRDSRCKAVKFRDIWARSDTLPHFFLEIPLFLAGVLTRLCKRTKELILPN